MKKSNEEMLEALRNLCKIPSVALQNPTKEHPYGEAPGVALEQTLALCEQLGMKTVNREGKIGWAEIGEGDEMVGVLAHLDVVPEGVGWTHPCFDLTEEGDLLYGRGVQDDKGPVIATIFAMHDLLENNTPLKRRIRLILGQCEEVGEWLDMEWYRDHEELPAFGFTPDGDFPAIYGEKGLLCFALTIPVKNTVFTKLSGGDASNMVASWCKAEIQGKEYETQGKAAHASTPEAGVNAIGLMMEQLQKEYPEDCLIRFYQENIGMCTDGSKMGCPLRDDKSGELTMNVGTARLEEDKLVLHVDVRNPVTFTADDVENAIRKKAEIFGIQVEKIADKAAIYMDKNGPVITELMKVYREETGDMAEAMVIGGGTYARAMDHIVAFGPILPGSPVTEHQPDEYVKKDEYLALRGIYRKALERLANL